MRHAFHLTLFAQAVTAMACSPVPDAATPTPGSQAQSPVRAGDPAPATGRVLQLSGLGGLTTGEAVPEGGLWATSGGQAADGCQAVRSAPYPGVYGLVEGGRVRRITVGAGSDVTLAEGLGVGASESDVRKSFAGFQSEPHKYEDAPAKYLTAPNAAKGELALRFEIGGDSTVKAIHVGQMPQLAYVEGCG